MNEEDIKELKYHHYSTIKEKTEVDNHPWWKLKPLGERLAVNFIWLDQNESI